MADVERRVSDALEDGRGILRLAPNWVPRSFLMPGRRLRLAREDLYVLGTDRGGIDERWFASTTPADNGPGTPEDEGLSYVLDPQGDRFLFAHAVEAAGAELLGEAMMERWGRWPLYCKFFDNQGPIPHHLHQHAQDVAPLDREHKPEAYYFPPQYNPVDNDFPYTFFGLEPGTTKDDVRRCLERWNEGDNGILDLSKAYRLTPGTGWLVPPGILHAPGSLCTYEVQWGSDVFAMYQSMVQGRRVPWDLLVKDVPQEKHDDLDYLVELIDWDANLDPNFKRNHHLTPVPVENTAGEGHQDRWVVYGKILGEDLFSAKELTLAPGAEATVRDAGACGLIAVQGRGTLEAFPIATPTYLRYGDRTTDEYFVSEPRAREGYTVRNTGSEPLVLLRYFGPGAGNGMPEPGDDAGSA